MPPTKARASENQSFIAAVSGGGLRGALQQQPMGVNMSGLQPSRAAMEAASGIEMLSGLGALQASEQRSYAKYNASEQSPSPQKMGGSRSAFNSEDYLANLNKRLESMQTRAP